MEKHVSEKVRWVHICFVIVSRLLLLLKKVHLEIKRPWFFSKMYHSAIANSPPRPCEEYMIGIET